MKRTFILFIVLSGICLTIISCHKSQVASKKPENLINKKTMVNLLTDCYMAEAFIYASYDSLSGEERDRLTIVLYNDIFKKYSVTKQQFVTSMEYYVGDKELSMKIFNEASENVSKMKMSAQLPDSLLLRPLESILNKQFVNEQDSAKPEPAPGVDL